MKKSAKFFFVTMMLCIVSLFAVFGAACGSEATVPFKVGSDTATYEVDGHNAWASTYSANVRIVAGDTEIFNGKVTLTSDNMFVSEFTKAAVDEKGVGQEGLEAGFVSKIGEYELNDSMYWSYTVNGKRVNWACNEMHVLEDDYIQWEYLSMAGMF